jgi:pimeloyl-ACP methyl ester carboxylesterase
MSAPAPSLPPAFHAERATRDGRARRLSFYVDGKGPPMLLLHSINAAASAYEMRPIFEQMRNRFRVRAVDLPGFGFSDRSNRDYTVRLFVDAVRDMLDAIDAEQPDEPVIGVGLSLSCEFLARAAVEVPDRFRALVLITPTGFNARSDSLRKPGATREVPGFMQLFHHPPWGRPLYDLLTKKGTIRYFLQRTYGSKDVHEDMVQYDHLTSRQPGAHHAPWAFLSGRLFSKDIRSVYEQLDRPVWLPHGTRGDFSDLSGAEWARQRPNWKVEPYETGALPHWERPGEFFERFDAFLSTLPPTHSGSE